MAVAGKADQSEPRFALIEAAIAENLYRLMEGKTVIAIAHRLSTIAMLDRLIVVDEGRLVESGTHQELLARNGIRRRAPWLFDADSGRRQLLQFFGVHDLTGFGIEALPLAVAGVLHATDVAPARIAQVLAELRGLSLEAVAELTTANAARVLPALRLTGAGAPANIGSD